MTKNYIEQYLNAIKNGSCIVSKRCLKQYEQLVDDIKNPKGGYVFDRKRAEKPINFIERFCKHSKGEWAGQPLHLELFQKAFISALFGFVDKKNGNRKYRETLFYVARKNGKSVLLSGIALYMLIADGEPGAEVYSVASKKDQAKIIFNETYNMVRQSPDLLQVVDKRKSDLYFNLTFSKFQPLGKNSDTLDGLNSSLVIIDELHSIKDRNLYEVMQQSQSARRQPLLVMISTAGTVRECIFDDMYKYACGVCDGTIDDPHFLPIIYELDTKEEWLDPMKWEKANPGLNRIKKLDDLMSKVARAKQSPRDLAGLLVKDFNMIQTIGSAWLTFDAINNTETFNIDDFRGFYCIGGADLSRSGDLTAATLLFMDKSEKRYVTQMYFLPKDDFEQRVHDEKIPYDKWLEAGLLRLCEGNSINYSDVTAWFLEMVDKCDVTPAWIYYDPYSAAYWVQEMQGNGFNMVKCHQGVKTLSLPMQQLGQDLTAKKINYNNNPLLKWCITNTGVKTDINGNIQPIKATSPKYRIDGLASLLDAYVGLLDHYNEYLQTL
ncbi:MAG: terminase large subunit [Lachnospiraceae bacterium]|nr:terminase large subunit [Lachnospiraceae bacterium]